MVIELSPSRLGLFEECPRCFWLAVAEGRRRPSGPFPSLPSGMDREIKAHFDRHRARGQRPPELDGRVDERLHADRSFIERVRDWRRDPRFVDDSRGVALRGAMDDLLETADGRLVVIDYKTRGYPPKGDGAPDYYRRQLNCYTLLLRETGHPTADHAYLLYYHPDRVDGADVTFQTDVVEVSVDAGAARTLLDRAVETLEGERPAADDDCEFCEWAVDLAARRSSPG